MVTPVAVPPEGTRSQRLVGGVPLASLVRDYHRPMVNFARTMVDSPAVAEEAVQEAWVQVLQSPDSFQGRSSVSTWLFGIVKHTASRHRRRESRIRHHEMLATADADPYRAACTPTAIPMPDTGASRRRGAFCRKITRSKANSSGTSVRRWTPCPSGNGNWSSCATSSAPPPTGGQLLDLTAEAQRALLYRARGNLRNELEKRYQR